MGKIVRLPLAIPLLAVTRPASPSLRSGYAGHSASLAEARRGVLPRWAQREEILRSSDEGGAKQNGPRWTRTSRLCLIRAAL